MAQLAVKLESVKSISLNVQIRAIYKQNKTKRKKKETALRKEIDSWTKVLSIFFSSSYMDLHCNHYGFSLSIP